MVSPLFGNHSFAQFYRMLIRQAQKRDTITNCFYNRAFPRGISMRYASMVQQPGHIDSPLLCTGA